MRNGSGLSFNEYLMTPNQVEKHGIEWANLRLLITREQQKQILIDTRTT